MAIGDYSFATGSLQMLQVEGLLYLVRQHMRQIMMLWPLEVEQWPQAMLLLLWDTGQGRLAIVFHFFWSIYCCPVLFIFCYWTI